LLERWAGRALSTVRDQSRFARFNTKVSKIAKITRKGEYGASREAHSITCFVILAILATFVLNPFSQGPRLAAGTDPNAFERLP
jgi:hypothetical protein